MTASLISTCCESAALSVEREDKSEQMRLFGEKIGIAFQLKDDIFDYGEPGNIGKPTGLDIRERKMTLPLIYTLNTCNVEDRKWLMGKGPYKHLSQEQKKNMENVLHVCQRTIKKWTDRGMSSKNPKDLPKTKSLFKKMKAPFMKILFTFMDINNEMTPTELASAWNTHVLRPVPPVPLSLSLSVPRVPRHCFFWYFGGWCCRSTSISRGKPFRRSGGP